MFFGTFHHRLNAKNQVTVPARFRDILPENEKLYIVRSNPNCLYLYTQLAMEEIMRRIKESSGASEQGFRRMFLSQVTPVDVDAQGRIVIASKLKDHAGVEADVVFIGNGERIEIWAADRWAKFEADSQAMYEEKLGQVMEDLLEK